MLCNEGMAHSRTGGLFLTGMHVTQPLFVLPLVRAGLVGFFSAIIPAYHVSEENIVEDLR
jgi:hypothetical protein